MGYSSFFSLTKPLIPTASGYICISIARIFGITRQTPSEYVKKDKMVSENGRLNKKNSYSNLYADVSIKVRSGDGNHRDHGPGDADMR